MAAMISIGNVGNVSSMGNVGGDDFNGQDGQCEHYDLTWQYGRDGFTGQDGSVSNG